MLIKNRWTLRWWARWLIPFPILLRYLRRNFRTTVIFESREFTIVGIGNRAVLTKLIQVILMDIPVEDSDAPDNDEGVEDDKSSN